MIELNKEQQWAYARFIKARDRVGLGTVKPNKNYSWVPLSDYSSCVDVAGLNHPLFVQNDEYLEYKEALLAWLAVEPAFRDQERMRMSRGDYGTQDSWEERGGKVPDIVHKIKEDK
jgi:hypothetical protein